MPKRGKGFKNEKQRKAVFAMLAGAGTVVGALAAPKLFARGSKMASRRARKLAGKPGTDNFRRIQNSSLARFGGKRVQKTLKAARKTKKGRAARLDAISEMFDSAAKNTSFNGIELSALGAGAGAGTFVQGGSKYSRNRRKRRKSGPGGLLNKS